jgi:hypothetical protein
MARQILTTNLKMKSVPQWSQKIHQFLAGKQIPTLKHTPHLPDLALRDFFFSENWKVHSKESIFSQMQMPISKWLSYLKHFHRMTLRDALRHERLVQSSV